MPHNVTVNSMNLNSSNSTAIIFIAKTGILYFLTNLALLHAPILSRTWRFYLLDVRFASSEKENVTIQGRGRCIVE
jgi:hypothetical protein